MDKELRKISFNEFATNLARIFDRVISDNIGLIIEKEGNARVILKPVRSRRKLRKKSAADYKAFLSAAGSWAALDTDRLVADIYASRSQSSRPPIQL